jgi:HD-like signal output (HDOD) protein/CheY-like chemotaxis protein
MKSVLFVDDEPCILDGLRRLLRGMRNEWCMHFAESGAAALELIEQRPVDVVVSDMRMPGMSGAELLAKVKERQPEIVRIVLSGHAETDSVMRAFGVAQQYLVKPCDQDALKRAIERAFVLKQELGDRQVARAVGNMGSLPAVPAVYHELVTRLRSPDTSLGEVARIISNDVAMTAEILKIVNSAYFALPRPLTTIERAVAFLGIDMIMTLTLEHGLFAGGTGMRKVTGFDPDILRRQSRQAAAVARMLARQDDATRDLEDEAFLTALLHGIGKLALAMGMPDLYDKVGELVRTQGRPWRDAELSVLSVTHAEVGAYLLGLWGFHDSMLESVLFHDTPSRCTTPGWGLAGIVHVATSMVRCPHATDAQDPALGLEPGYLAKVGMADRWPDWRQACEGIFDRRAAA